MSKLWVKYNIYSAVKVSTEICEDIADFKEAIKKKLSPDLDYIPPSRISISLTEGGPPLEPDAPIPSQNTAKTPLFVTATENIPPAFSENPFSFFGTNIGNQTAGSQCNYLVLTRKVFY
jgi:hypothetical protein